MIEEPKNIKKGHIRLLVCFVAWFSIFALYTQRINLTIGIIGMIKGKPLKNATDDKCPSINKNKVLVVDNLTTQYDWDEKKQNYLLLAFNVGYLVGHIPGALLSIKYGPRIVMICCLLISTILTVVSISATRYFWVFFAIRSLVGLSNGPLFPIIHQTIANYAPAEERTFLLLFTHTGTIFSLLVTFPVGGYLVQYVADGWKYIFYMSGVIGIISFILWTVFVYSEPEENRWMSKVEKSYIVKSIYPNGKPPTKTISNIPFGEIFSSRHLYILTCGHLGKSFILYLNLFGLVKYLFSYYDLTRPMAGNLAVIPFLVDFLFQLVYPKFVVIMKNKGMALTNIRKLNTFIGSVGSSFFLIMAGFLPCTNIPAGIIVSSLSLLFLPAYQAGYYTAIIEFAPQYSDVNMAIINVGGSFAGVFQRYLTGLLLTNISDIRLAYRYSFIVTAMLSISLSMVFVIFGTAELQPWAKSSNQKDSTSAPEATKDFPLESGTEVKIQQ